MNRLTAGILESQHYHEISDMIACAAHGKKGGEFVNTTWANGFEMVEFLIAGQKFRTAVTRVAFEKIRAAGWKVKI